MYAFQWFLQNWMEKKRAFLLELKRAEKKKAEELRNDTEKVCLHPQFKWNGQTTTFVDLCFLQMTSLLL